MPVRVLIADDHGILREGLISLLKRQADIELVGEARDGLEAVEQTEALKPDIVLMDVNMPRMDGIEATREIKRKHPETSVIGLSMFVEQHVADAMYKAGASAYFSKEGDTQVLFETIRRLADGSV
jgi:DNA-binding NarL/FixJ family response regulator